MPSREFLVTLGVATEGQTLTKFLGRFFDPWRIGIIVTMGGIVVTRRGKGQLAVQDPNFAIQAGDAVERIEPWPKAVAAAYAAISFRDLASVNSRSVYQREWKDLFDARDMVVDDQSLSIAEFLRTQSLSATGNAHQQMVPVRDLWLATHGSRNVQLMFATRTKEGIVRDDWVDYEDLLQAKSNGDWAIDQAAIRPRPGGTTIGPTLHIRACNIGKWLPYVEALQDALGPFVTVVASKHFEVLARAASLSGWLEYMKYTFRVMRRQRLTSQAQVRQAFSEEPFKLIGQRPNEVSGKPVPKAIWKDIIPARFDDHLEAQSFPRKARSPVPGLAFAELEGTYDLSKDEWTSGPLAGDVPTGSGSSFEEQLARLLTAAHPLFAKNHRFPLFVREGYQTIEDFVRGYTWSVAKQEKQVVCSGTRYVYTVGLPIVSEAGVVYGNFYPRSPKAAAFTGLPESDARFFVTVPGRQQLPQGLP
jgi:hypothetical protein